MSSEVSEDGPSGSPGTYGDPDTRTQILAATREVLTEHGAALKLTDVASRANVSRQAIYLHFGDRAGLLLGLVLHMDETLDLGARLEHVRAATSGADVIARTMALHEWFSREIDPVAQVLDAGQYQDEALGQAWRDRMQFRRGAHAMIVGRIAELGDLADAWTVEEAAEVFYAATLPHVWRECIRELGWTAERYMDHFTRLLQRALLV